MRDAIMPETVKRTVVVTDPAGVHARTALAIKTLVEKSDSQVKLTKNDRQATANEVLQILTMVVEPGEQVEIEAVGSDAAAVADALELLFAGTFNNDSKAG